MREMKDSGVEWIGKIPADWQVSRLKYLVSRKTEQADSGAKYIGLENIESFSGNYVESENPDFVAEGASIATAPNDVIFGKLRPYLAKCYIVKETGSCSTEFIVMEPVGVDASFLQLLLLNPSVVSHINMSTYGTKMPRANWEIIGNVLVPYAPKEEQQKIVRYLSSVCSKIDNLLFLNRAQIEELRLYKQSLITETVTRGLDPDAPMKDSGVDWIGAIPAHWNIQKGKNLFHETNERSIDGSEELLTVSHITGITPRSQKNVNMFLSLSLADYKICHVHDIAANTMWMWQGAIGVSDFHGVVSPSYNTYRQTNNDYLPKYLDYLLRCQALVDVYVAYSTGITKSRLRLYPEQFLSIMFPVPPIREQERMTAYLNSKCGKIDALISLKQAKIEKLTRYRQSLIYEYVTGKKEAP